MLLFHMSFAEDDMEDSAVCFSSPLFGCEDTLFGCERPGHVAPGRMATAAIFTQQVHDVSFSPGPRTAFGLAPRTRKRWWPLKFVGGISEIQNM